ncbi:MAG: hypothetical protein ACRBB0_20860 [Pelagimonas sp.]|uniref:hypothetical protein n=1 Tax=Pelagimonas sp. TaxID=2073170 RepID=UPI003D6A35FB
MAGDTVVFEGYIREKGGITTGRYALGLAVAHVLWIYSGESSYPIVLVIGDVCLLVFISFSIWDLVNERFLGGSPRLPSRAIGVAVTDKGLWLRDLVYDQPDNLLWLPWENIRSFEIIRDAKGRLISAFVRHQGGPTQRSNVLSFSMLSPDEAKDCLRAILEFWPDAEDPWQDQLKRRGLA